MRFKAFYAGAMRKRKIVYIEKFVDENSFWLLFETTIRSVFPLNEAEVMAEALMF